MPCADAPPSGDPTAPRPRAPGPPPDHVAAREDALLSLLCDEIRSNFAERFRVFAADDAAPFRTFPWPRLAEPGFRWFPYRGQSTLDPVVKEWVAALEAPGDHRLAPEATLFYGGAAIQRGLGCPHKDRLDAARARLRTAEAEAEPGPAQQCRREYEAAQRELAGVGLKRGAEWGALMEGALRSAVRVVTAPGAAAEAVWAELHRLPGVSAWLRAAGLSGAAPAGATVEPRVVLFLAFAAFLPLHAYMANSRILYEWSAESRRRFDYAEGEAWGGAAPDRAALRRHLADSAALRFTVEVTRALLLLRAVPALRGSPLLRTSHPDDPNPLLFRSLVVDARAADALLRRDARAPKVDSWASLIGGAATVAAFYQGQIRFKGGSSLPVVLVADGRRVMREGLALPVRNLADVAYRSEDEVLLPVGVGGRRIRRVTEGELVQGGSRVLELFQWEDPGPGAATVWDRLPEGAGAGPFTAEEKSQALRLVRQQCGAVEDLEGLRFALLAVEMAVHPAVEALSRDLDKLAAARGSGGASQ